MVDIEHIVYLLRKTNLTIDEIRNLELSQFYQIVNETYFQESIDKWETQHNLASLLAAIYNTIPRGKAARQFSSKDFYDVERPSKVLKPKTDLDSLAKEIGIKLP